MQTSVPERTKSAGPQRGARPVAVHSLGGKPRSKKNNDAPPHTRKARPLHAGTENDPVTIRPGRRRASEVMGTAGWRPQHMYVCMYAAAAQPPREANPLWPWRAEAAAGEVEVAVLPMEGRQA